MYNPFPTLLPHEVATLMIAVGVILQGVAILMLSSKHNKLVNTVDMWSDVIIDKVLMPLAKPKKKRGRPRKEK